MKIQEKEFKHLLEENIENNENEKEEKHILKEKEPNFFNYSFEELRNKKIKNLGNFKCSNKFYTNQNESLKNKSLEALINKVKFNFVYILFNFRI